MKNWRQTILSQYWDSPSLTALLGNIEEWISPDKNLEAFYNLIWNVDTAEGYGLDVWGRIVNVSRIVQIPTGSYFGFGEAGDRTGFSLINFTVEVAIPSMGFGEASDRAPLSGGQFIDAGPFSKGITTDVTPYQQSTFYNGPPATQNYPLPDEYYRILILAKAAYNITDGSIPAINAIMRSLFPGRGNAYVIDGGEITTGVMFGFGEADDRQPFDRGPFGDSLEAAVIIPFGFGESEDRAAFDFGPFIDDLSLHPVASTNMTMIFAFDFVLSPAEIAIVNQANVLPKPVGVKATVRYMT